MSTINKIFKGFIYLIFAIFALAIIFDIGLYFWLKGDPDKVHEMVKQRFGHNVEVGTIRGEFFFGFDARDVVVFPSDDPSHQRMLRAADIYIDLSWPALIQGKISPGKVMLDDFDVFFTIDKNGKLVFPSLNPSAAQGGTPSGPLDLPSSVKVTLSRGSVYLNWHLGSGPPLQGEITKVSGNGSLSRKGEITIAGVSGWSPLSKQPLLFTGRIDTFDRKDLELQITSEGVNLLSITDTFASLLKPAPEDMLPRGVAKCDFRLSGPFNKLVFSATISLTAGRLANIMLESADLNIGYKDGTITLDKCRAKAYGGDITLDAEARFAVLHPGYRFNIDFQNVDVNTYIEQIGLYFSETDGDFSGHFEGYGEFKRKEAFVAQGDFTSTSGTFRSPYIPSVSTTGERLAYDALRVDFKAGDKKILIEDVLLDGPELSVVGRGSVDSEKFLDLNGQMKFPTARALRSPKLKKWGVLIPADSKMVLDFNLYGDINHPRFETKPPATILDVFKKAQSDFLGWFHESKNKSSE